MRQVTDRPISRRERLALASVLCALGALVMAANVGCQSPSDSCVFANHVRMNASEREPGQTAASVMASQQQVIDEMTVDYGVSVDVRWKACGEENSFYYSGTNTIVLCSEMLEHPGAAVAFAAHEMGHSVTAQLASETDEGDADELAAIAMAKHHYWMQMLEAAMYMRSNWTATHVDGDSHPAGGFRAWQLACVESAAEAEEDPERPAPQLCKDWYAGLRVKWAFRFNWSNPV